MEKNKNYFVLVFMILICIVGSILYYTNPTAKAPKLPNLPTPAVSVAIASSTPAIATSTGDILNIQVSTSTSATTTQ